MQTAAPGWKAVYRFTQPTFPMRMSNIGWEADVLFAVAFGGFQQARGKLVFAAREFPKNLRRDVERLQFGPKRATVAGSSASASESASTAWASRSKSDEQSS